MAENNQIFFDSKKIDEMTSLDRVKEVSSEYGLTYNSENIKTIK